MGTSELDTALIGTLDDEDTTILEEIDPIFEMDELDNELPRNHWADVVHNLIFRT